VSTFDNAASVPDRIRKFIERSREAATQASHRASIGRGVEGAAKLAARGVDDSHLAFREVLHTVAGQDAFRGLPKDAQDQIIQSAADTNRLLASELEQVRGTQMGERVPTMSARDSATASDVEVEAKLQGIRQKYAPVGESYDTLPSPKEMGERRRIAGNTTDTVMKDGTTGETHTYTANTPRPETRAWLDRVDDPASGDIQTRTALPEVPGGDLRKVQEVKPGRYPHDINRTMKATVNPAAAAKGQSRPLDTMLAEIMTAHINNPQAGLLTPDEIRALQPHFKSISEGKKGDPTEQLTLESVGRVVDNAITRLAQNKNLSDSEASLLEKGKAWQGNQTLYRQGAEPEEARYEVSTPPHDKTEEEIAAQRSSILGVGITTESPTVIKAAGGDALAKGDEVTTRSTGSGATRVLPGAGARLMESVQGKRTPLAQHLMTAENPDGTLKYPYHALQTALEDVARIEPNTNWHSFDAAVLRSMDYINAQRKADGLPPANFGREFDKYVQQKSTAVGDRVDQAGSSPNSDTVEGRKKYSIQTQNALAGIRSGLEQMAAKNPVTYDKMVTDEKGNLLHYTFPNSGTPVDPKTMSAPATGTPAGDVVGGTAQSKSAIPAKAKNVQPKQGSVPVQKPHPDAKPGATGADISTDKQIADAVAGKSQPTTSLLEAVQGRQDGITAKINRGDKSGADADQKEFDALVGGWDWKKALEEARARGAGKPVPQASDAEALPPVPESIDLGTPKKGRGGKPKAEKPVAPPAAPPAAVEAVPAATPAPVEGAVPAPAPAKKRGRRATDASPVAPPAAAKPEPVPASREQMELAASQMGMSPDEVAGMDDAALFKNLSDKASSGETPFKGADPRFIKRKYSTGEVAEGENLPEVPEQKVLDAGSQGELATVPKVGEYKTGEVKDGSNATIGSETDRGSAGAISNARRQSAGQLARTGTYQDVGPDVEVLPPIPKEEKPYIIEGEWEPAKPIGPVQGNPNPHYQDTGPIRVAPNHWGQQTNMLPELENAEKWAKRVAVGAASAAGVTLIPRAFKRKSEQPQSYEDIYGPSTFKPEQDSAPPASSDIGGGGTSPSELPESSPAPVVSHAGPSESAMTSSPDAQHASAALEAMKQEQIRQEVLARRAAVESTLRRIGQVRGMGNYGPAY